MRASMVPLAVMAFVLVIARAPPATACLPRCPTPEGALRSADEEGNDAFECDLVVESFWRGTLHTRPTNFVRLIERFLEIRRRAATFRDRAARAAQ